MLIIGSRAAGKMWWLGDKIPDMPVPCEFWADGHELQMIVAAMEKAYIGKGGMVEIGQPKRKARKKKTDKEGTWTLPRM